MGKDRAERLELLKGAVISLSWEGGGGDSYRGCCRGGGRRCILSLSLLPSPWSNKGKDEKEEHRLGGERTLRSMMGGVEGDLSWSHAGTFAVCLWDNI